MAVNNCRNVAGEVMFIKFGEVLTESFLKLLNFYLKPMLVEREGNVLQRMGICIGSCVAPVLSDIFLY